MAFLLHAKAISPNALTSAFASAAGSAAKRRDANGRCAGERGDSSHLMLHSCSRYLLNPSFWLRVRAAHVNWDQTQLLGSEELMHLRATCSTLQRRLSPMQMRSD